MTAPESAIPRTAVVLLWHMHQPEYRVDGVAQQPWTYLHALRAYADMAAHLEAVPGVRVVVNFSPALLDQLLALADAARNALAGAPVTVEPLLAALAGQPADRATVVRHCLRAHGEHGYGRFPPYAELAREAAARLQEGDAPLATWPHLQDLVCWYHLIWLGEHARRSDARVAALVARGRDFDAAHRRALLELVADTLGGIIPRYAALARSGRVELAVTPYFHPLLPLLDDFASAREASPGTDLPAARYPGGAQRARWHCRAARERFAAVFDAPVRGCWPAEGALSDAALDAIADAGFAWTAGGERTWALSRERHDRALTSRWLDARGLACLFRDDGLSDRIGFVYKDWAAADAVRDLVALLERSAVERPEPVILLALDGENPWEWYRENGIDFVRGLYAALVEHPRLRLATPGQLLDEAPPAARLPGVVAGSWVHGELLTWIGHADKNRCWELLCAAKRAFDGVARPSDAAQRALGVCEASDWMWWPGAHNPSAAVLDFERLFRAQVQALYHALELPPPPGLERSFVTPAGEGGRALGAMMPSQ